MMNIRLHVPKRGAGSTADSSTTSHEDVVKRRQTAGDSDDSSDKEARRHSASDSDEAGKSKAKRATPPLSPSSSEEDTAGDKKHRHRGSARDSQDVKAKRPKSSGRRKVRDSTFVVAVQDAMAAGHSVTEEHAKRATPPLSPSSSEEDTAGDKKHRHRGTVSDSQDVKEKHPKTSGRRKAVDSPFVIAVQDSMAAGHSVAKGHAKRATPPLSPSSSEEDTAGDKKHRHRRTVSDSEDVKAKYPKTSRRREAVNSAFVVAVQDAKAAGHSVTEGHAKRATPPLSPSSSEDDIEENKRTHRGSARDTAEVKAKHPKTAGRREVVESTFVVSAHDANPAGHNATHPPATSEESALVADEVAKAGTAVAAAAAAAAVAVRLADQRTNDECDLAQRMRRCSGDPHVTCIVVALGIFLVYCLLRK
ncbi:hypothetical protein MTO96_003876 [Rhipicephalus appendiculatus]